MDNQSTPPISWSQGYSWPSRSQGIPRVRASARRDTSGIFINVQVGLTGKYFSLPYLAVSDATVQQFLTPMCVDVIGALLLKERLTLGQIVASRRFCIQRQKRTT